jgi:hypothetical protein
MDDDYVPSCYEEELLLSNPCPDAILRLKDAPRRRKWTRERCCRYCANNTGIPARVVSHGRGSCATTPCGTRPPEKLVGKGTAGMDGGRPCRYLDVLFLPPDEMMEDTLRPVATPDDFDGRYPDDLCLPPTILMEDTLMTCTCCRRYGWKIPRLTILDMC